MLVQGISRTKSEKKNWTKVNQIQKSGTRVEDPTYIANHKAFLTNKEERTKIEPDPNPNAIIISCGLLK